MTQETEGRLDSLRAELDEALQAAGTGPSDAKGPSEAKGSGGLYTAQVVDTTKTDVVVELSPLVQGVVPLEEFDETPEAGAGLQVALRGREDGLWLFSVRAAKKLAAWKEMEVGSLVKGRVTAIIKGGVELEVGGAKAFLPASQVALHHVEDLNTLAGETLVCEVLEVDASNRRAVVSRRAVLEEERRRRREEAADMLSEGSVLRGKVARLESYGAFVDIGGVEGLLHVSNMAHRRVEDPAELVKVGQEVEVQVLSIEEGGRRIGLGMKQLEADPWEGAEERYPPDGVVSGRVLRFAPFGAFVELQPGLEGLLHVSQLGSGRVSKPNEVLKIGEQLTVRVIKVDEGARRISLSRLDPRGALIGSEESAAGEEVEAVLKQEKSAGTNLGALLSKAMKEKG